MGDGGPATQALLDNPWSVTTDAAGNIYVLDSNNYRIREFTAGGDISTVAQLPGYGVELKIGKDGNFYVSIRAQLLKVSPAGAVTVVAGIGAPGLGISGSGQDGIQATASKLSAEVGGIAFDAAGDIYFADGNRVREVTADGIIHTVAGTTTGYSYNGDNIPAATANLCSPGEIAMDSEGNLYIADYCNSRIREVSKGIITTVAGNGAGFPVSGPATDSPLGFPFGLAVDPSGAIYFSDPLFGEIFSVVKGTLTQIAGSTSFGYSDGPAASTYLQLPFGIALDSSGDVLIAEEFGNRVRELVNGNIQTIAGQIHFAGDGGPAISALLYNPTSVVLDGNGDVFIQDSANYRIREVTPDGNIRTFAGKGIPDSPFGAGEGMAIDKSGNLYYADQYKVMKVSPDGTVSPFAGGDFPAFDVSSSGDGGPAGSASFGQIGGIAVDTSGNVYIADTGQNRVRVVSAATGIINDFAGSSTGNSGYTGDHGPAKQALLNLGGLRAPLAVDPNGNVYIGDAGNYVIRKVSPDGTITTLVGNGNYGVPADGQSALSAFINVDGMTVDSSGQLYLSSGFWEEIYRLDIKGIVHVISGGGAADVTDGAVATSTTGFSAEGVAVDGNGDVYAADPSGSVVRKLILNSPASLTISSGNNQSEPAGVTLPVNLGVLVGGRGGVPVPGVSVSFTVTSGSANLSSATAATDVNGNANVSLTLGAAAGSAVVTAAVPGTTVASAQFTETATTPVSGCTIGVPSITSVKSATDFGGSSTWAPGSWLEIKGSNLTSDASPRQWASGDFQGDNAPTSLDGSAVTIDGNAGFISYISSGQINAQAPADSNTGPVQITVTTCGGTSAPVTSQEAALAPGLLAPASFNVNGKQYLVATFADASNGLTYVGSPGFINGVAFQAAKPGDLIVMYGIGFGPVSPAIAPGVVVTETNSVPGLSINFGTTPASIVSAGLAGNYIGLYEFYVTVPNVPDGDYQINVSAGGAAVPQTVYLTVQQ